jgi:hypothetical protein
MQCGFVGDFLAIIAGFKGRRRRSGRFGPVAEGPPAAYIPAAFQSSSMTLSGFARKGGRSTEEI